jgi:hypothetical protein
MNYMKSQLTIAALAAFAIQGAMAQLELGGTLLENCGEIEALKNAGDFAQARDKAQLCLEGLDRELVGAIGLFFREEIGDWTRVSFEQNEVMGFNNISAVYRKGDISVNVALLGQAGGGRGAVGRGLGELLGGLAQQAARQQGGRQVTVGGRPAAVAPDGTLTVSLENGSMLSFESRSFNSPDAALQGMGDLVNDFPVREINAASM